MKKLKIPNSKVLILYVMYILILLFLFSQKLNYHVDEWMSFPLANQTMELQFEEGVHYTPSSLPFIEIAASDGHIDIANVWEQQSHDTHPPLWYLLLHIICSFFPGTISMRYPAIINLVFQLSSFYSFRKILRLFVEEEKILYYLSIIYIFNTGILSNVLFFENVYYVDVLD